MSRVAVPEIARRFGDSGPIRIKKHGDGLSDHVVIIGN
jgi:hypothetical protein